MDSKTPSSDPALVVDTSEQTVPPFPSLEAEDLDSYNPTEPPPLDWKSDSSSEEDSTADDPNAFSHSLDKASPEPAVPLRLDTPQHVRIIKTKVLDNIEAEFEAANKEQERASVVGDVSNMNQHAIIASQQTRIVHSQQEQTSPIIKPARVLENLEGNHQVDNYDARDMDQEYIVGEIGDNKTKINQPSKPFFENFGAEFESVYASDKPLDNYEARNLNQDEESAKHFGNGETEIGQTARVFENPEGKCVNAPHEPVICQTRHLEQEVGDQQSNANHDDNEVERSKTVGTFPNIQSEFEGVQAEHEEKEPVVLEGVFEARHFHPGCKVGDGRSALDFGDSKTEISHFANIEPEFEAEIDHEETLNQEDDVTERERLIEDEDHSHIHSLLNQLQFMGEDQPCPVHGSPSVDARSSSPIPDETTGLLFSENHQRDVVGLLQCTELSGQHEVRRGGEVDAVVSVSYSQEDSQKYWGRCYGKAPPQAQREDSFSSQPDEEEPEPVWMKLGEDPPEHEAAGGSEDADDQPSYKDVPGPCDPEDLLDGVIFGAKYLGSTQLKSDKNPSTNARMKQAQEAVDRIKAPEGESQPMTEVDLFISTKRIKVLTADTQEAMMDHPLQMISYIADIGEIVVLMARRKRKGQDGEIQKKCLMICHVFTSDDAQVIAQAIGQAFGVAYQQFLQTNGIKASDLKPGEYSHYLESQELYNGDLAHFSDSQNLKEVVITKAPGDILGLAIVESGWGSILPTVVVANMLHGAPAERCGELSIGDRVMSVNGTSLVGLPISTCQNIIRDLKSQKYVKLSIVHCPPVTMAIIRRPDPKYQLGFSVEDGIICSLMRGGIAERGGIRVGHRIIEINGQSVVATTHDRIIQTLTNAVGEIHLKTMPASTYRLLTGQEQPVYL